MEYFSFTNNYADRDEGETATFCVSQKQGRDSERERQKKKKKKAGGNINYLWLIKIKFELKASIKIGTMFYLLHEQNCQIDVLMKAQQSCDAKQVKNKTKNKLI